MAGLFVTDGGLETSLIFHQGLDLPEFASFVLLEDEAGRTALRDYFEPYIGVARRHDAGFVLDTATWRANPDWGEKLGYSAKSSRPRTATPSPWPRTSRSTPGTSSSSSTAWSALAATATWRATG
jgi:S-methylmethionine-dependent homocysteine/selenocysteine methylase